MNQTPGKDGAWLSNDTHGMGAESGGREEERGTGVQVEWQEL